MLFFSRLHKRKNPAKNQQLKIGLFAGKADCFFAFVCIE